MDERHQNACCGNCVFIDQRNPADVFCRAHPPTIVVMREKGVDRIKQFFPNVHPVIDYCGEHEKAS